MLSALLKLAVTSFLMQNMKIPPLFKAHKFSAPRGVPAARLRLALARPVYVLTANYGGVNTLY